MEAQRLSWLEEQRKADEKGQQELQSMLKEVQESQAEAAAAQARVNQLEKELKNTVNGTMVRDGAWLETELEAEKKALATQQEEMLAHREKHDELEQNVQVQLEKAQQKQKEVCAVIKEQADKVCGSIPKFKVSKKVSSELICFPCVQCNAHHTAHVVFDAHHTEFSFALIQVAASLKRVAQRFRSSAEREIVFQTRIAETQQQATEMTKEAATSPTAAVASLSIQEKIRILRMQCNAQKFQLQVSKGAHSPVSSEIALTMVLLQGKAKGKC